MTKRGFTTSSAPGMAILAAAWLCGASLASAGDLRPTLDLPSMRDTPNQVQQVPSQQTAPSNAARVAVPSEQFYWTFETQQSNSNADSRKELFNDIRNRYKDAQDRNAGAEMQHYARLMDILRKIAAEKQEEIP